MVWHIVGNNAPCCKNNYTNHQTFFYEIGTHLKHIYLYSNVTFTHHVVKCLNAKFETRFMIEMRGSCRAVGMLATLPATSICVSPQNRGQFPSPPFIICVCPNKAKILKVEWNSFSINESFIRMVWEIILILMLVTRCIKTVIQLSRFHLMAMTTSQPW